MASAEAPDHKPVDDLQSSSTSLIRMSRTATVHKVDITTFGAVGDGKTDDSLAINSAIQAMRAHHSRIGRYDVLGLLVFPAGVYSIESSLDFTNLRGLNTLVQAEAAVLVGRCANKPVIDALGSRWLTFRDLTVIGDEVAIPSVGIQIGVMRRDVAADDHSFENVKVLGRFATACIYNRGSETSGFDHVLMWNDQPDSYCLIQDGLNHFNVISAFAESDLSPNTDLSFNENEFINCDFRHSARGSAIWLGDTSRHDFIRCYAATSGQSAFVIHCGPNSHTMLDIDCHIETAGLQNAFLFEGKSSTLVINGFAYKDHCCFAERFVLSFGESTKMVEIRGANIAIASYGFRSCLLLSNPHGWAISGSYYSGDLQGWNADPAFCGVFNVGIRYTLRLSPL